MNEFRTHNVKTHFDLIAKDYDFWKNKSWYYYREQKDILRRFIPPGKKVLEIGCATGDILTSTKPKQATGWDISNGMIKIASHKYPGFNFQKQDIYKHKSKKHYDYIVLVDLMDHLPDIYLAFKKIVPLSSHKTRIIITTINPVWEPFLHIAERLHFKMPEGPHNWVTLTNLTNLLDISNFRVIHSGYRLLIPKHIPWFSKWVNNNFGRINFLKKMGFIQYLVCEKKSSSTETKDKSCSVIIPVYNESANLENCIRKIPRLCKKMEIIIVDDGSTDTTNIIARKIIRKDTRIKLVTKPQNQGKALAVETGIAKAAGEIIIIFDADQSVPPEELNYFYEVLSGGNARFCNGTRMVYPMEHQAMRSLHLLGNRIFSSIFSRLLNQQVTDTLCGTKAFFKIDFKYLKLNHDPWGDFDLLLHASRKGLIIKEIPVHYRKRQFGESKMQTFKHGWQLIKTCYHSMYQIKFLGK